MIGAISGLFDMMLVGDRKELMEIDSNRNSFSAFIVRVSSSIKNSIPMTCAVFVPGLKRKGGTIDRLRIVPQELVLMRHRIYWTFL